MRKKCAIAIFATVFMTESVAAGPLRVTGETGLVWNPETEVSPVHTFRIAEDEPQGLAEPVFLWQLALLISPDPSATGSVLFRTASIPTDYLFGPLSLGLSPQLVVPTAEIPVIADSSADFPGAIVPAAGANLLDVDFEASQDASGLFNILVQPFKTPFDGSGWISGSFSDQSFADLTEFDQPLIVGTIFISSESTLASPGDATVPEPSMLNTISLLSIYLIMSRRRGFRSWHIRPSRSCVARV